MESTDTNSPFALLDKNGFTVRCRNCEAKVGNMSRLVDDEELKPDYKDGRIIAQREEYDPVRAHKRAQLLESAGYRAERGKPYFIICPGYIAKDTDIFALTTQHDARSPEGSAIASRRKGLLKKAEKIFPKDKRLFEGLSLYRMFELEEGQEAFCEEEQPSDDKIVYSIYGHGQELVDLVNQTREEHRKQAETEIQARREADSLRDTANFLASSLKNNYCLQLPPFSCDSKPILIICGACGNDVIVILQGLGFEFEKMEQDLLQTTDGLL